MQDEDLLRLLQKQPEKGLKHLMDEYTGLVWSIARAKLSQVCSDEDIEELASDIFLLMYYQSGKIDLQKGSVKAYLAVITARKAVNLYRKKMAGAGPTFFLNEDITALDKDLPEEQVQRTQARQAVVDAIKELAYPDREIIIRRVYFSQSAKAIAQEMNLTSTAVDKRISRCYERLRGDLGGIVNE